MTRIAPEDLRSFAAAVLAAVGVPDDDAALVADSLVQADLWGHQSHGLLRLPWYVARLRSGAMRVRTDPVVLSDTGPLVLLDGRDGIGQVLTERARVLAVARARAREHRVGVVGVRHANHLGTAMYCCSPAARRTACWRKRRTRSRSRPTSTGSPRPCRSSRTAGRRIGTSAPEAPEGEGAGRPPPPPASSGISGPVR